MARNLLLDFMAGYNFVDNIQQRGEERKFQQGQRDRLLKQQGAEDQVNKANEDLINQIFGEDLAQKSPQGYEKAKWLSENPEQMAKALILSDEMIGSMNNGKLPDGNMVSTYMNTVGKPELDSRAQNQGLYELLVNRVVPSPDGKGLMVEFNAKDKTGKQYRAPMTTGASSDPKDKTVQQLSMEQLMNWFGGSRDAARKIMIAQARAGNPTALNMYRKFMQDYQAGARELATYEKKKQIDQRYDTSNKKWVQNRQGEWILMNPQDSGKVKGQPEEIPASMQKILMEQAEGMAKEEASKKAGLFRSDKQDFPGGRKNWINNRTIEIYNDLSNKYRGNTGESTAAAGGMTAGQESLGNEQAPATPQSPPAGAAAPATPATPEGERPPLDTFYQGSDKGASAKPGVQLKTSKEAKGILENASPAAQGLGEKQPAKTASNDVDMEKIYQIESTGNTNAVSEKGARGLGQITQPALDDWNKAHPDDQMTMEEMHDPEKNKKVSRWYMNDQIPAILKERGIADSTDNRIISYHAGIDNLEKHLKGEEDLGPRSKRYLEKYHAGETKAEPAPQPEPSPVMKEPSPMVAKKGLTDKEKQDRFKESQGAKGIYAKIEEGKPELKEGPLPKPATEKAKEIGEKVSKLKGNIKEAVKSWWATVVPNEYDKETSKAYAEAFVLEARKRGQDIDDILTAMQELKYKTKSKNKNKILDDIKSMVAAADAAMKQ